MLENLKSLRQAATLILAAKTNTTQVNNYKLLTIKRSAKSSFMPETVAFPGGVVDKYDKIPEWMDLYEKFGINKNSFDVFKNAKSKTPIFDIEEPGNIPNYLSFRIAAIRETFEECGVLLCRSKNAKMKNSGNWASCVERPEILEWQKKVHNDASQLLELCQKYEICPDIWALYEWSNWITPVTMKKRFDTVFFFSAISSKPTALADFKEIEQLKWKSPKELLLKQKNDEIILPPPQYYEISRLLNFENIDEAVEFAKNRSGEGSEQFLPHRIFTNTYEIALLPGDDLYPGVEKAEVSPKQTADSVPESKTMHRMKLDEKYRNKLIITNYTPKCGHKLPILFVE